VTRQWLFSLTLCLACFFQVGSAQGQTASEPSGDGAQTSPQQTLSATELAISWPAYVSVQIAQGELVLGASRKSNAGSGFADTDRIEREQFAKEFARYQHERDGIGALKATLAVTEGALGVAVLASNSRPYLLGIAGVASLRVIDFFFESGLIAFRHGIMDHEIKTRDNIRSMRRSWQRAALSAAALNIVIGGLSCIGWATVKDDLWKGLFTGLTIQTVHGLTEELIDAFIMRPW
jgi:hypothetical protein